MVKFFSGIYHGGANMGKMTVYHGGYTVIQKPKIIPGKNTKEFVSCEGWAYDRTRRPQGK